MLKITWILLLLAAAAVGQEQDGRCPAIEEGAMGICVDDCGAGKVCPDNQVCCRNGCGHTCFDVGEPEAKEEDPRCPSPPPAEEGAFGTCVDACDVGVEGECPLGEVCCSNGCGHTCTDVTEPEVQEVDPRCPSPPPAEEGSFGTCVQECGTGVEDKCPSGKICCSNGCGNTCIDETDKTPQGIYEAESQSSNSTNAACSDVSVTSWRYMTLLTSCVLFAPIGGRL